MFATTVTSIVLCEWIVRVCGVQRFKDSILYGKLEGLILKQMKFGIGRSSS